MECVRVKLPHAIDVRVGRMCLLRGAARRLPSADDALTFAIACTETSGGYTSVFLRLDSINNPTYSVPLLEGGTNQNE